MNTSASKRFPSLSLPKPYLMDPNEELERHKRPTRRSTITPLQHIEGIFESGQILDLLYQ